MLRDNGTRQMLRAGKPAFGTFSLMSDPWVVEIVGNAGYDFVGIDMEHTSMGLRDVEQLIRAADAAGISPIVRVPELHRKTIQRVMDIGGQGIFLPLVEDAESAALLRSFMAYPPRGTRSTCSMVRAADQGMWRQDFKRYVNHVNDHALAVALIETQKGVENLDEILREDIDVVLIGRADLSADMGLFYDVSDERMIRVCEDIIAQVNSHDDRWAGILAYSEEEVAMWLEAGCKFVIYSQPEFVLSSHFKGVLDRIRNSPTETG